MKKVDPSHIRNPAGHVESLIEYRKNGGRCWLYGTRGIAKPNSGSFKKGHKTWIKGKHMSDELKKRLSEIKKGKPGPWRGKTRPRGEDNPNWRGGRRDYNLSIRSLPEYQEWRLMVFGRDHYTCLNCGARGRYLHAHHIEPIRVIITTHNLQTLESAIKCSSLWDVGNGITLCYKCHEEYHYA